jgi:hypothetical protein
MKLIRYAVHFILLFNGYILFGMSNPSNLFLIWNKSDAPIKLTIQFKHFPDGNPISIDYYENNIFITTIKMFSRWDDYKRMIYNVGRPYLLICEFDPNEVIGSNLGHYINLFHFLVEKFIIYDDKDCIIMTLNDITEAIFTFSDGGDYYGNGYYTTNIYITQETIETGRRKYAGLKE